MESEPTTSSNSTCLNCHTVLKPGDRFCSACGQKVCRPQLTLGALLGDFLAQQFAIEGRLIQTLKTLLFFPGRLTIDYWQGRRARYFSPIQIYLVTSLFLFLMVDMVSVLTSSSPVQISFDARREIEKLGPEGTTLPLMPFGIRQVRMTKQQLIDFMETKPGKLQEFFAQEEIQVDTLSLYGAGMVHLIMQPGGAQKFFAELFRVFSQAVIVLMPVLGFILYGLYYRRSETSVKCIVFSAHVHAFAYLTMILASLTLTLGISVVFARFALLGLLVYFVWAQRVVFGGRLVFIVLKSLIAVLVYFTSVLLLVLALLPIAYLKL